MNWDTMAPAGGIISSANDLARWLRMLLGGGTVDGVRVLSEESARSMRTPTRSMRASTRASGSSISAYSFSKPRSTT